MGGVGITIAESQDKTGREGGFPNYLEAFFLLLTTFSKSGSTRLSLKNRAKFLLCSLTALATGTGWGISLAH